MDFLIRNAKVVDGSGSPPFPGEIAIKKDRISRVGMIGEMAAKVTIDAAGKVVAPGFIDMHSHSDVLLANGMPVTHKIMQGVTTELIGQDGISAAPLTDDSLGFMMEIIEPLSGTVRGGWAPWDMKGFLSALVKIKTQSNVMTLTGHCNIRMAVMGHTMAKASAEDLEKMQFLLARSLEQGSFGLSLGLIYPPSSYSNTQELIALGKTVNQYDRILIAHIRNEQDGVLDALDEMITIGLESGCRIHISHLKCLGKISWGKMPQLLDRLDWALNRGVRISFDQYPYDASCTSLSLLLPDWALEGGWEGFRKCVDNPENRRKVLLQVKKSIDDRGGPDAIMIASVQNETGKALASKTVGTIAAFWFVPIEEAVFRILYEAKLGVIAIYHAMSAEDVECGMKHRLHSVGSDGVLGEYPHPRAYGTFPRIISHFCAARGLFPLEEAIRKMTSWPAKIMNLHNRGVIKEGNFADLVVFDPSKFKDNATYDQPMAPASGLDWVFINGNPIIKNGRLEKRFPGRVLCPER